MAIELNNIDNISIPEVEVSYIHDFNEGPFVFNIANIPTNTHGVVIRDYVYGGDVGYYDSRLGASGPTNAQAGLSSGFGGQGPRVLNNSNKWYIAFQHGLATSFLPISTNAGPTIQDNSPANDIWSTVGKVISNPKWTHSNQNDTLAGSYVLSHAAAGTYTARWAWYLVTETVSSGLTTKHSYIYGDYGIQDNVSAVNSDTYVAFNYHVLQKAVAVVRYNTAIQTNASLLTTAISTQIDLDATDSRGQNLLGAYEWLFYKKNGSSWTPIAYAGPEVNPISGGQYDGAISFDFAQAGEYKITLNLYGEIPGSSPGLPSGEINTDTFDLFFNIDFAPPIDIITFPAVIPSIEAVSGTSTSGDGYAPYTFIVSHSFSGGSWTQQEGTNTPVTLSPSNTDWENEISARCHVRCVARRISDNSLIKSVYGFGPHTFKITEGQFRVGYEVSLKTGTTQINTEQITFEV